jgi:IclR family pca regulon transcriptional regulator
LNSPSKPFFILKSLLIEFDASRIRGYSLNNEEFIPGLIAIGAPLKNFQLDKVVGAVSFDFSTNNYSIDMIQNDEGRP